jgi:hypothetical protein
MQNSKTKFKIKKFLLIFLSILFWLQVSAVVILGIKWLLGRQPVQQPQEVKTPAMIRNKI